MNAYTSFEQWKSSGFLEHGAPRKQEYTEEELALVEMGWKYGHDAALSKVDQMVKELRPIQKIEQISTERVLDFIGTRVTDWLKENQK
jgi:hypothetical protein